MRRYPDLSRPRTLTIAADVAVVLAVVVFAWLGTKVHDGVEELLPVSQGVQSAGRSGAEGIRSLANLLGWLTFLVPSLLLLSRTIPPAPPARPARRVRPALRHAVAPHAHPLGDLAAGRLDPLVAAAREDAGLSPRP